MLGLVSYAWAGFGAAFGPVVLFSVMWSRMTRCARALAGMIIGALTVIVWKQFGWLGLYEIPGFIFGSIGIIVFSCWVSAVSGDAKTLCRGRCALSFGSAVTVAGRG